MEWNPSCAKKNQCDVNYRMESILVLKYKPSVDCFGFLRLILTPCDNPCANLNSNCMIFWNIDLCRTQDREIKGSKVRDILQQVCSGMGGSTETLSTEDHRSNQNQTSFGRHPSLSSWVPKPNPGHLNARGQNGLGLKLACKILHTTSILLPTYKQCTFLSSQRLSLSSTLSCETL